MTRRYGVRAVEPYLTSRSSVPSGDFPGAARSCRGMTIRSEWCPSSRCELASTGGRDLRSSSECEGGSRDFRRRRGMRTNERGRLPSVISPPIRCYSSADAKLKLVMNGSILSRPWFGYLCALAFNSWRVDAALSRQEQRRGREPEEAIDELIARTSPECAP